MSNGKKIAIIGGALLTGYAAFSFSRRTSNLTGKFKINSLLPDRVNLEGLTLNINFPHEVINQSSVNVTLRNLVFNVAYKNEEGQWTDLLIQKRVINEVNFPPGRPMILREIPLTIGLNAISPLAKVLQGILPGKLLVTTRFDVAGIEIEPISTEIDAASMLLPVKNFLKRLGLVNGLDGNGYSKPVLKTGLTVSGVGYSSNSMHYRKIKDASKFAHLIPAPKGLETEIRKDGSAYDTIDDMKQIVESSLTQTKKLAEALKGSTREETVKNIYTWLHDHIQYKHDKQGVEQLREPSVSFAQRQTGIDCDCFSIFASSLLLNSGIDHYIQMCKISPDDWFKHVYVVVPKQANQSISNRNNYWVVDPCLHQFDEKAPNITQTYSQLMKTTHLSGLDASCKCAQGVEFMHPGSFGMPVNNLVNKAQKIVVTGNKTGKTTSIAIPDKAKIDAITLQILEPMRQQLIKTKEEVRKNPSKVALLYKPDALVQSIDYALKHWNHPEMRQKALDVLAQKDAEIANNRVVNGLYGLSGLTGNPIYSYPILGFDGLGNAHEYELAGLFKSISQGAKNVTEKVKNVATNAVQAIKNSPVADASKKITQATGNALKNVAQAVVNNVQKFNPAMVTARTAYRGLVALNFRGQATKMANALTTKAGEEKIRNFWTSNLIGGNMADLISAINAGKGKKAILGSIDGLGEPITLSASIAAATPVLVAIEKVLDTIDGAKESIKPVVDTIQKVQTVVNDGKAAYSSISNLVPSSGKQNQVLVSPPNSGDFVNPDPGMRTNEPANNSKSNNGLLLALGTLLAGGLVYAATSNNEPKKKSISGVPSITI